MLCSCDVHVYNLGMSVELIAKLRAPVLSLLRPVNSLHAPALSLLRPVNLLHAPVRRHGPVMYLGIPLDIPVNAPIYCVNRPPGARYPSPSHKGSLPKCSVIRRLRKRMRIGRR